MHGRQVGSGGLVAYGSQIGFSDSVSPFSVSADVVAEASSLVPVGTCAEVVAAVTS